MSFAVLLAAAAGALLAAGLTDLAAVLASRRTATHTPPARAGGPADEQAGTAGRTPADPATGALGEPHGEISRADRAPGEPQGGTTRADCAAGESQRGTARAGGAAREPQGGMARADRAPRFLGEPREGPTRADRALAALARLGRRIGVPTAPSDLDGRLAAAGLAGRVRAADLMAMKAGAGAAAALAAAPVLAALPLRLTVVTLPAVAAAGFLAPDAWLVRRARRRARRAGLELADVLDLLRVAVAAGLPTGRALTEVGRRRGGLVASELRALAERLELGVPRGDAVDDFRRRLPLPAIATLCAAIARADRHGAPLTPALAALAEEARAERARALREEAARAAPRIQLAIALLLVPAVLLLVAAGLVHGLA